MMKFLFFIILTICSRQTEAVIGYDCSSKVLNMTTVSLIDIDECDLGEERIETFLPDIVLLQLNEYEHTNVIQCKIEIHRVIQHCGWQSYNSIVSQGINDYIHHIDREMCQVAHDHGTLKIGNTVIDGLVLNTLTTRSITLAGSVNTNADCTNSQYSDPFGTWDNVFVIGTAKITLKAQKARVKVDENKIYFASGHKCNLGRGHCIEPEYGYSYWDSIPRKYCMPYTYSILYKGVASKLKSKTETVYSMTVRDTSFSLSTVGAETSCGLTIIRTEHPKLFIVETKDSGLLEKSNIVDMNTDNTDMFLYVNAKFVFVERYIRTQVQSLYLDVIKNRCKLEREVLKNALSIASTQPDEFAYRYMDSPGFMAVVAGEVIHIIQCVPVEITIRHAEKCYNRMPVSRGNQSLYLTPRTHILTNYATELPCNSPMLQYYKQGSVWYKFMPKPVEAPRPKVLKPSTKMTWVYQNPSNLAIGGIYTQEDLDAMRGRIMFTMEQAAVIETVAQQFTNGSRVLPPIYNTLNKDLLDKLADSAWSRTWGKFTGFGTYCADIIGIVMCFQILKFIVDTAIHGYALHTVYGWSLTLFGAVWDSFTHLLLHMAKLNQEKKEADLFMHFKETNTNQDIERGEQAPSTSWLPIAYPLLPKTDSPANSTSIPVTPSAPISPPRMFI